jgi:endonuclease/exonuclease/phosphatase family protein
MFTAVFLILSIAGYSGAQTVRCTTWNLEWFPNGSAKEASAAQQEQRIKEAANILRPINPNIVLLQEVRDYDACARLGEAIAPGVYHVAICSAFKEPFQRGLGKQQVAILSKYQAQAEWAEPWKSMNGVDPPRGFAFAWFKIGNENIHSDHYIRSLARDAQFSLTMKSTAPSQNNISIIATTPYRGLKRATNWEVHPITALWKCTKSRHACDNGSGWKAVP